MVRFTDRPDMTLDVNRGRKTTTQQQQFIYLFIQWLCFRSFNFICSVTPINSPITALVIFIINLFP